MPLNWIVTSVFIFFLCYTIGAQVSYNAAVSYGTRKLNPSYSGNAIQIRRSCDNATKDIGFNACGGLDTAAIRSFILIANPLSAISTASSAAFSMRKLNCAYAGNAIRVRRSSDNTTQDIGFTADGDLDTAAMKTFVGANNGFVTIWYDQSGNGRNATQGTAGNQPRIINAGVVERQGGRPSIYFQGVGFGLFTGNLNIFGTNAMFNGVARVNTNVTYNAIVNTTNVNLPAPLDFYNNQVVVGNGTTYTFHTPSQTFDVSKPLGIWTYNGTSGGAINMYYNSTSVLAATATSFGSSNRPLAIGSRNDGLTGLNGWISEIVTFAAIPSATDRLFVEWTQSQYYGISGISMGTLPAGVASAFVTTWYDQSGNARNATQTTNANQPLIMSAGVLSSPGGVPALQLDGTNHYLRQTTLSITNPYSANAVAIRTANGGFGGYQRLINISATLDGFGYMGVLNGNYATFTGNGTVWNDVNANTPNTAVALNAKAILSMDVTSGATGLVPHLNGTTQTAKDGTSAPATGFLIGAPYTATNTNQLWTGTISEFSLYPAALSTTRRRLFESNESAYHNITISNNKYTPPSAFNYNRYVNGVGRESSADSVAGTRSSVGMGFRVGQTGTDFLKDNGDYITIGIGCPVAPGVSSSNITAPVVQRWANDWYLNKTDVGSNNGDVTIYFDFSEYGVGGTPGNASQYRLLSRSTSAGTFAVVTVTTTSVSGDRVSFLVDAANLTTNTYYTIGTINISSAPLPVELIAFDGKSCNANVCLHWETATEINNSYFSVERSTDAINFEEIGNVNTKAENGNSNQQLKYTYKDSEPFSGISYYRLTQYDINGDSKRSNIISVQFDPTTNIRFVVYPNPNKGIFSVDFSGLEITGDLQVTIMDLQGKTVYRNKISTKEMVNTFTIVPDKKINAGTYLVVFEIQGEKYTSKIAIE